MKWVLITVSVLLLLACKERKIKKIDSTGSSTAAFASASVSDTTLKILRYGLPLLIRGEGLVTAKYGFRYYSVAGCIITEELVDSVKKENERVYAILDKRWGPGWQERMSQDFKAIDQLYEKIENIAAKQKYIIEKEKELDSKGNGMYYDITPTDTANVYTVKAYGRGDWNGETEMVVYYKLLVNERKKSAVKLSSVIEPYY